MDPARVPLVFRVNHLFDAAQRLIAFGIPDSKLHGLISHWASVFSWKVEILPEIHLTQCGKPGEHSLDNPPRRPVWDWRKADGSSITSAGAKSRDFPFIGLASFKRQCYRPVDESLYNCAHLENDREGTKR
jgi:hypothetical protein